MSDFDKKPVVAGVGEPRSRRIPGREDVPEEIKTTPAVEPGQGMDVSITLDDLRIVLLLLDACAQRGTFQPAEFMTVGQLYEKVKLFISIQEKTQA